MEVPVLISDWHDECKQTSESARVTPDVQVY